MNLYIRYFDSEALVTDVEDAIAFLSSIQEIEMNQDLADDIREYYNSDMRFPKRYKLRSRVYFILIKTEAADMKEFKANRKMTAVEASNNHNDSQQKMSRKQMEIQQIMNALNYERKGWYQGTLDFKRVIVNPMTGKSEYRDSHFVACCKAKSAKDCYDRIIEHLSQKVDKRSQFPSIKGPNYQYTFLGKAKQEKKISER